MLINFCIRGSFFWLNWLTCSKDPFFVTHYVWYHKKYVSRRVLRETLMMVMVVKGHNDIIRDLLCANNVYGIYGMRLFKPRLIGW